MPSTGPPERGELGHRLHRGREARDRPGAQVVAVGEAARAPPPRPRRRRSRSPCQISSASAKRRQASRASTSSQLPGKRRTPNLTRPRPPARPPRNPRSAGWRAAARTSRARAPGPRTSSSTSRPTCTSDTPSKPSAAARAPRPGPDGSRMPSFGRISTRAVTPPAPLEPGAERLAGDPLVRLLVARPRALHDLVGQRRRGRRLVPARPGRPVAHELLVEARLAAARLVAVGRPEARRVGGEHLVAEHDRAVRAAPELELRVGQDDPALARVARRRARRCSSDSRRSSSSSARSPTISAARSKSTFSSWSPTSAFVAGREDRLRELLGLAQARRQLDPADGAGGLVVLPARAR